MPAPVVSFNEPANAAPSGIPFVTISGLAFGHVSRTPSAVVAAAGTCGTTAWTSGTTVACGVAALAGPPYASRFGVVTVSTVESSLSRVELRRAEPNRVELSQVESSLSRVELRRAESNRVELSQV